MSQKICCHKIPIHHVIFRQTPKNGFLIDVICFFLCFDCRMCGILLEIVLPSSVPFAFLTIDSPPIGEPIFDIFWFAMKFQCSLIRILLERKFTKMKKYKKYNSEHFSKEGLSVNSKTPFNSSFSAFVNIFFRFSSKNVISQKK